MELPKPRRLKRGPLAPEEKAFRAKTHEARVEYVANLMRSLDYRPAHRDRLATEWNLPEAVVSAITKEASVRVRAEFADDDRTMAKVTTYLNKAIDDAAVSGDLNAVIKACDVLARVTGAGAPNRSRVEIAGELAALSPEQLAARKAEIVARLAATVTTKPEAPCP